MTTLSAGFLLGLLYFIVGFLLFVLNFYIFRRFSGLDVDREILGDQNAALGSIVRGQLIGQSIMIGSLIYFFGANVGSIVINGVFYYDILVYNLLDLVSFGLIGILMFQLTIWFVGKIISLEKDILIDQNEAVGRIIEGLLIANAILLSLAIYSY